MTGNYTLSIFAVRQLSGVFRDGEVTYFDVNRRQFESDTNYALFFFAFQIHSQFHNSFNQSKRKNVKSYELHSITNYPSFPL